MKFSPRHFIEQWNVSSVNGDDLLNCMLSNHIALVVEGVNAAFALNYDTEIEDLLLEFSNNLRSCCPQCTDMLAEK